ncbi:MAG: murG, partial [Candidatus Saccharibacteria bacterium]|nr:murG [Candidatus Saccharibacteria bacterium]
RNKSVYVGVPIDSTFQPVSLAEQRAYKEELGVDVDKKLIVATGGGLGALSINDAMAVVAANLSDVVVYNITGKKNIERALQKGEGMANYLPVPFVFEGMHKVLGAADIVVSRASATFLQELAGLKKTVIAVPARQLGDQQKNAHVFKAAGAIKVLSDADLEVPATLTSTIQQLLEDTKEGRELAAALHKFARPQAAADTAELILSAAKGK